MKNISKTTQNYLFSKGITLSLNSETGLMEVQRIDEPETFAIENELHYIPPFLESDDKALDIVSNISEITLNDETINNDIREIIIEDCFEILTSL
jgi:hypothetical protein